MPGTTSKGHPYALPGDNVADWPDTSKDAADRLELFPMAIAAGIAALPVSTTFATSAAVTFPVGRFTQAPVVGATLVSGAGGTTKYIPRAYSVTTTGMTVACYTADAAVAGTATALHWTAIQMTPTSAAG